MFDDANKDADKLIHIEPCKHMTVNDAQFPEYNHMPDDG